MGRDTGRMEEIIASLNLPKLPVEESWEPNYIKKIVDCNLEITEKVICHEIPIGKQIEILFDKKTRTLKYSLDAKVAGAFDSSIGLYLAKNIYPKLSLISEVLFNQEIHFYGFIGKNGFEGTDIYVNRNWLDFSLTEGLYKDVGIKTPKITFTGLLENFKFEKTDNFMLRRFNEPPNGRQIYYLKAT
jgi:hypothetical protein